jgi:F0F1-type ATP synthase delta subunit
MKKHIQKLVLESYNKHNLLDAKTVDMIADMMNRQSLKQYIHLLKQEENKKQVIITSPKALTTDDKKKLETQFPGKKIIYVLDPEMISGIRIIDKDTEYETSLNQTFNDIIRFLEE